MRKVWQSEKILDIPKDQFIVERICNVLQFSSLLRQRSFSLSNGRLSTSSRTSKAYNNEEHPYNSITPNPTYPNPYMRNQSAPNSPFSSKQIIQTALLPHQSLPSPSSSSSSFTSLPSPPISSSSSSQSHPNPPHAPRILLAN